MNNLPPEGIPPKYEEQDNLWYMAIWLIASVVIASVLLVLFFSL